MYHFNSILSDDEVILYEGQPTVGKGDKRIKGELISILILGVILAVLTFVLVHEHAKLWIILIFAPFMLTCTLAMFSFVYSAIYKRCFKDRAISDDHYCITNQRVIIFEEKKQRLAYGYFPRLNKFEISEAAGGYGDVIFSHALEDDNEEDEKRTDVFGENLDTCDCDTVTFQSVANPEELVKIAEGALQVAKDKAHL